MAPRTPCGACLISRCAGLGALHCGVVEEECRHSIHVVVQVIYLNGLRKVEEIVQLK